MNRLEKVAHRQENQGWQEKKGKQPLCITNFFARVFPLDFCTEHQAEHTNKLVSSSGFD